MAEYAVVRTDNLHGTDVRAGLVSLKYYADSEPAPIENGMIVKLGELLEGERELFQAEAPEADTEFADIVLVATPELMYDERKRNLDEFINEADMPARGYFLYNGDRFSVTAEALDGKPAVGSFVELQADTKMKVVASATEGSTQIGRIIAIETAGRYTYYVILVRH